MFSPKKLKPYIITGGILFSLIFSFSFLVFRFSALALDVPTVTGLSTRSLADTAVSIINAFLGLVGVIALGIFVYGGYLWMFSAGDPKKIQNAKKVLTSAVIGLIIILLSWAIVSFIFNALDGGNGNNNNNNPPPFLPPTSYSFRVDDYSPKGNVPVAVCMPVQARFSAPLDQNTLPPISSATFHLRLNCSTGGDVLCGTANLGSCDKIINTKQYCGTEVSGAMAFASLTAPNFTFRPINDLEKNAAYLVTINGGSNGVRSQSGSECVGAVSDLGECKQWEFTTNDQTDKVPPQVAKVSPVDAATNVCRLKSIAAQFNEEMDETTLRTAGAFSINPADTVFSASVPSYTVLRENPSSPMTANASYTPLLNSDIITDACGNFLDGNEDGISQKSPADDYAPPPINTVKNWSFITGETTQCVPMISNITPTDSYYDAPNNTLTITGENFDDIADTILFTANLPITTGSLACFNGAFTQTDQACFTDSPNPDQWTDTSITIKTPAGGLDSNGAISGPVKIQIGRFTCTFGQQTCIGGVNKGLACADDNQCPASSCGSGSCSGGSNAGNGCVADAECSGAESEGVTINVLSPHINSISPSTGAPGTWITISGAQFGATAGIVRVKNPSTGIWTDVALPCANSWNDNYIIIEIPTAFPTAGFVNIQVIDSSAIRHSNINGEFILNNSPLGPGICAINPSCGPTGTSVTIDGKRFGAAPGSVSFGAVSASALPDWNDIKITATSPTQTTDGTYPVKVVSGGDSNSLPFNTLCTGRPRVAISNSCPGLSPNPKQDSVNNCVNLNTVAVRFDMDMVDADLTNPAYVSVWQCNAGAAFGGSGSCTAAIAGNLSVAIINPNSDEADFSPTNPLTADTWYELRVSGNVKAQTSGLTMNTDFSSPFHIRPSNAFCDIDAIDVLPDNWTMAVGATRNYIANAISSQDICNILTPPATGWSPWTSSTAPVAEVTGSTTNTDTATGISSGAASISATLNVGGALRTDSANLTVTDGGAGPGGACNNDGIQDLDLGETGVDCGGAVCPACAPGGVGASCDGDIATPICNPDDNLCNATPGLACSTIASCTCQVMPTITATDWCKDGTGITAGKNTAITVKFSTLMDATSFKIDTGSGGTVSLTQAGVFIDGSLRIINNGTITELTFYPNSQLGDNLLHTFIIKGGADGVKSKFGIRKDITQNYDFTTGTNLCKIDKVVITLQKDFDPDPSNQKNQSYIGPDLFTCAGKNDCPDDFAAATNQNQHNAIAQAFDANGQELSIVAFSWTKSADAPFTMLAPGANETLVQADPKSGIGALTVKADGGLAGVMSASTNITVAPCDNPWPPAPNLNITYPFQDNGANPTNFSLWYCRDAGAAGTADDLPALNIISKDGAGEMIKEFFFYDNANPNDALGLRVYNNLSKWPAKEWYDKRAPNKSGSPASTTVDGWEGVQAGRTIYVNAANHTSFAPPLMNIYLMSHSDKVSANLQNIYSQLKSNWKFAITEYDDGTDGTTLSPPANQGHLRKLQRDTKRITDLYGAAVNLYQSKISKGKYPLLPSGSYINGNSTSVWPSWDGMLSQEVGAPMPHDPISQMSSLVGWWKMDDDTGGITSDSGSYNRDGTLQNGPSLITGTACKYGNCLEFDGTDDFVDLGSFSGAYSNKLTVSAWVKVKNNIDYDDIVSGGCYNFLFTMTSGGKIHFGPQCGLSGGPNGFVQGEKKVDDDKWHFVAATYDGLVMKLYIDGVFEKSASATGSFVTAPGASNSGKLFIGTTDSLVANDQFFKGSIDEVRIWNTPLGDAEINNLFKSNAAKFGSSEDSGWDQTKNAFICSAGADYDTHIYHYVQENNVNDFSIYAALEWVGGDGSTWRQKDITNPYAPCTAPSSCACYNYRQQEVNATDLGLCGNGQWDSSLGEVCDSTAPIGGLNGLEGRICATGVCSAASANAGISCTNNLQCPGGTCTPGAPSCDASCQPFCAGAPVVKAVCGNGTIESPVENCECADFNNNATCGTAKGLMNEYYCLNQINDDDLGDTAAGAGEIDDDFNPSVTCRPTDCNLTCGGNGNPIRAEANNAIYEPWVEQCEPARGYCSGSSASCTDDASCGANAPCIALGNGGYYCDDNSAVKCNNGTRSCAFGTLTSCIGGNTEWLSCGGDNFPPKPYNYLDNNGDGAITDLYGWCFR